MAEPLVSFTDNEFEDLMKQQGLEDTTRGVVGFAQGQIGEDKITYESLRDGTAPLLDLLPEYEGLDAENRQLNDEEILGLFTNVEDYGKYDPDMPGRGKLKAFTSGAAREAPEAIAGGFGFSAGVRAAMPVANLIPPAGLPGFLAKGAVILGGGITGAIAAALTAEEAEKAVIGEQVPVVPSLEGARRWGEGTMLGLSMLHSPWTLTSKTPQISKNIEFLENFKEVASGRFATNLDDAAEFTAKNAGLSDKAFKAAKEAAGQLAEKGTIFGKGTTGAAIGFKRFNPSGLLFDPTKGPIGSRIGVQIEEGISKSLAGARERPIRFGLVETAAGVGGGFGSLVSQQFDPYDESSRFIGEVLGAAAVPLPLELIIDSGPRAVRKLATSVNNWRKGDKTGILTERLKRDGGEDILKAIQASEEYTGPEQLEVLIGGLLNGDVSPTGPFKKRLTDPDTGEIVPESPAKAAKMYGLPLANTLNTIETSLSKRNKELAVTSAKGKEQLLQNAKDTVEDLISTGEPAAILAAARVQQGIFEEGIQADLASAVNTYMGALKRVRGDDVKAGDDVLSAGSDQVTLGETLYNILNKQINESKRRERQLWDLTGNTRIDEFVARNGRTVSRPNSLNIFDRSADRNGLKFITKGQEKRFNDALKKFGIDKDLDDLRKHFDDGEGPNPVTAKKLYAMRGDVLNAASELKKGLNPDSQTALFMRRLADSLFQDMMRAGDTTVSYNTARAYTYARNNVFTRSFLGEMQVVDPDRSLRMDPEDFAKAFFRGGNSATAKRIDEINTAVKFGVDHGLDRQVFDSFTTQETIDILVRDSLKRFTVQKPDGSFDISERSLQNWRNSPGTKEIFQVFPLLEQDTRSVIDARRLLEATNSDMLRKGAAPEVIAFNNFVETANKPLLSITRAISGEDPKRDLQEYVNLINKSPDEITDPRTGNIFSKQDALDGLRVLILDEAVHHAGGLGLGFSPTKFFQRLDEPIKGTLSKENFNLMDFMSENKLIDSGHRKDLTAAIARMRGVEDAFAQGAFDDVLFREVKPASLFQARIAGATFGQKAQESFNKLLNKFGIGTSGGGIGGGMIAAEAGSDAVVNFLLRGPQKLRVQQMSQIFNDREALGLLLKDIKTEQDAKEAFEALGTVLSKGARQVGRRLPYAGALGMETMRPSVLPEATTEEDSEVGPVSSVAPTAMPAPPPVPAQPVAQPTTTLASVSPPPPPQAPSGPVDRTRYAAMFPNDPASALIRQQGIGSLMG
mgnify:CR=1 FL=1